MSDRSQAGWLGGGGWRARVVASPGAPRHVTTRPLGHKAVFLMITQSEVPLATRICSLLIARSSQKPVGVESAMDGGRAVVDQVQRQPGRPSALYAVVGLG